MNRSRPDDVLEAWCTASHAARRPDAPPTVPTRRGSGSFGLVAVAVVVLVLTVVASRVWRGEPAASTAPAGSSTTATSPAAGASGPGPVADASYRLGVVDTHGSLGPVLTISSGSDCATLPSDWLRSVCELTLRSDWHAIIAQADPSTTSATWWASFARAEIDGDTTLCADASMRTYISVHPWGGAPSPGATPAPPLRPIAACIAFLQDTAAKGFFVLDDQSGPGSHAAVRMLTSPGAAARAASGVAPAFDPLVACNLRPLTRDDCNRMLEAVTIALGARQSSTTILFASGQPIACTAGGTTCPSPSSGTWLGSVSAGQSGGGSLNFDVAQAGGGLTVVEVPGQMPADTSPRPPASVSPMP